MWLIRLVVQQNVHAIMCGWLCWCRLRNSYWYFGDNGFAETSAIRLSASHSSPALKWRSLLAKTKTRLEISEIVSLHIHTLCYTICLTIAFLLLRVKWARKSTWDVDQETHSFDAKLHALAVSQLVLESVFAVLELFN